MLATQLNPLVEEERLSSNCICQINRFIVNTLKDGRYVVGFFPAALKWGPICEQRGSFNAQIRLGIKKAVVGFS